MAEQKTKTNTTTKTPSDSDAVLAAVDEMRAALKELSARVQALEKLSAPAVSAPREPAAAAAPPSVPEVISDDTLAVIAAAVAAFLGKRAHVRQVRLISSSVWPQQGRAWVQASHRLER